MYKYSLVEETIKKIKGFSNMDTIEPIKINAIINKSNNNDKLTSAEIGKLWVTFMGNSMSNKIISYFLQHIEDDEIKKVVENALSLTEQFMQNIKVIFNQANFPIPAGFTEEDVNLHAPRLFLDEYYLHYLKYVSKAGLSIYGIAIPLMVRQDVRDFFINCLDTTVKLMTQINDLLLTKGILIKPPYIPIPDEIEFVKKQTYKNRFIGDVRPLNALEVLHLHDNIETNATSKAFLIGFSQVAKLPKVKEYFVRGRDLSTKHFERFSNLLHQGNLPSPVLLDHLVTESTISPYSDKLMVAHKLDMFSMRVRTYGNSAAVNARPDIGLAYARSVLDVRRYVEDGASIMIEMGWLEQPPHAADRDELAEKE